MQINRVQLENYRIHKNFEIDFDKGLNLILGKNGSGKSSILEALGIALLDIAPRSTKEDTISNDARFAKIVVYFTANDALKYRVEKRIGQSSFWKLFVDGENSPRYGGNKDVPAKIAELIGIEKNATNLYKHVITAYQNKLTEVFQQKDTDRATIFNQIFDTEIYRNIYNNYAKYVEDKYDFEVRSTSKFIEDKSTSVKDCTELEKQLSEIELTLKDFGTKKDELTLSIAKNNSIKTALDAQKSDLDKFTELLKQSESNAINQNDFLSQTNERLLSSIEAKLKADSNREFHDEYSEKLILRNQLTNEKIKLDKVNEEKIETEKYITDFKNQIQVNKTQITNFNERIEKNQNKSIELTDKIQTLQSKIKSDEDKIETKNLELTKQNNLLTIVKEAIEEIKIIDSRIDRANTGISTFETGLTDEKMLEEELQSILSHIENFKKLSLEKSNLERDAANIKSRMKDNEEASSLLGKGYCPFLEEECGNLKKGSSPDEFFRIKDIHFNEELNNILTKIKEIGNPEQEQSLFENAVGNLEQKINKNNSDRMSINKLINDRKAFMLERDNSIKDFQIILLKNNFGISFESSDQDMSTIEIDTRKIIDEFNMEISSLKATNVADKKTEKDLTTQINTSNVEIRDWNFQVNNFANQNNDISTKLSSLESDLNNLNEQLKPYSALKVQLETINNKLNSLKPAYDAYLQNKKMADSIPSIEKEISGIKEQMQNLENEIKDYKDRISNLNLTFSQQELDNINQNIKEQTSENENFHLRIGTIEAEIKNLKREIAENNNLVIEIDNLKKSVAKLALKKSMTIVFRQNLRDMGKMVAARKLNGIAETATVNYQNISGKSEVIQWINDENNTYQVLLKDRSQLSKPRKFEMLSGGEQVTVAIAIRSAIASTMTHSNLAIFDEPTINLDSERRLALADSLKTMLEKLEQAIIVTHDDTFREMAQKTIELP